MRILSKSLVIFLLTMFGIPAWAIDINLVNIDMNSPSSQGLSSLYGDAYGFPAQQVAPALLGPAEEVPALLQIAQAAGTVPMSVWMMRRMGMSYSRILQTFALGPTALLGSPLVGSPLVSSPGWLTPRFGNVLDPFLVQSARYGFLRSLPPGIAKKHGLWIPPGQAKKLGGWGPGPWGWKGDKGHYWVDDDDGWDKREWKVKKNKHEWKHHAKGHHQHSGGGKGKGKGKGGD